MTDELVRLHSSPNLRTYVGVERDTDEPGRCHLIWIMQNDDYVGWDGRFDDRVLICACEFRAFIQELSTIIENRLALLGPWKPCDEA